MTQHPIAAICRTLKIGRATPYRTTQGRPAHYRCADDRTVAAQIREVIRQRGAYGYRRVIALVNRTYGTTYNRKRIRRLMKINAWNLPRATRRRSGRAHTGRIMRPASNERWCSDTLEITCANGEYIHLGFVLDCHDREAIAHRAVVGAFQATDVQHLVQSAVQARFGTTRPVTPLQFLSDNSSIYTALATVDTAERLGLTPVTTPAYSPQSNGMSEAFVNTLRRDYLDGADRSTAAVLMEQVPQWIIDYNGVAPHSALRYRPPTEYRQLQYEDAQAANAARAKEDTVSS
jgi:putative transposase